MEPVIRSVSIRAHYNVIAGLMRGLHASEQALFDGTESWDAIAPRYMQHVMDMQEECAGTCLIAYVGDAPAGFIFGYEEAPDDSRIEAYAGKTLYVSDGFVEPACRRLGIYRRLNAELEDIYIRRGVRRIVRFTLSSNTPMQRLLERQHYRPVRMLYEKWLTPDGQQALPLRLTPPEDPA